MDILVQADGVTLSEVIKDAIDEKIGRVELYAPRAVRARVRLRKVSAHPSPRQFTVRVLVEIPGADLSAEESSADVIGALEVVAGKIERRLRKRKTDRLAKRVRGTRRKP
ncbi:MAG TPA: ribosome-associated translation inhibitor RaiA [Verrucomicrobiae bacterium]|nr:ribosome-associated translation inhibitor RaiA [Verrucomicrobiae bacterium]